MIDQLAHSPVGLTDAILSVTFSLVASLAVYVMYQVFYGSSQIGAGVHRAFILGGPAITTLFIGIQTSIPLSLGLLGALSFVRFRTPVKDPAEIGFLLLLIASSIGAATNNYILTVILFVLVFVSLSAQRIGKNRLSWSSSGNIMISIDHEHYENIDKNLTTFMEERVPGIRLLTLSNIGNRTSLHYRYRRNKNFDWADFCAELDQFASPIKIEAFIN